MATYRENDILLVTMEDEITYRVRVDAVTFEDGEGNEVYEGIIMNGGHRGDLIEFEIAQVEELVGGPTNTQRITERIRQQEAEREVAQPTPLQSGVVTGTTGEHHSLNMNALENLWRSAVQERVESTGLRWFTGIDPIEQEAPRQDPIATIEPITPNEAFAEAFGERLRFREPLPVTPQETIPVPMGTIQATPRRPARRNREIVEATADMNVSMEAYSPTRDMEQLYSFRLVDVPGTIVLTPTHTLGGGIVFVDGGHNTWVNQIQREEVREWFSAVDINGIRWMSFNAYNRIRTGAVQAPMRGGKKSKKKLRMKYDNMPVIREEHYYASKDFIA